MAPLGYARIGNNESAIDDGSGEGICFLLGGEPGRGLKTRRSLLEMGGGCELMTGKSECHLVWKVAFAKGGPSPLQREPRTRR